MKTVVSSYLWGICSKTPSECLKPGGLPIITNPVYGVFILILTGR